MSDEALPSFKGRLSQFKYDKSPKKDTELRKATGNVTLKTKVIKPSLVTKVKPIPASNSKKRGYAEPEKYSHLRHLVPLLRPGLLCIFIGYNPGVESALQGHYYAHRSNLFWKLIYESGCVDRQVTCKDDQLMMEEYSYGFHDLVCRPTKGIDELSPQEMHDNVPRLEGLLTENKPRVICFVGKGIWEKIYRFKTSKPLPKTFKWGLQTSDGQTFQPEKDPILFAGGQVKLFVMPSTSGLAAGIKKPEKLALWVSLAQLLEDERLKYDEG